MRFLQGHFSDRDLSAGDLAREDLFAVFEGDPKMQAIFGPNLHTTPLMPSTVDGALPDFWVTNLLTSAEDRPGWVQGQITLHLVTRFPWPTHEPVRRGQPGLDTLRAYYWRLIQERAQILYREVNSVRIPYTKAPKPGGTGYGQISFDPDQYLFRLATEVRIDIDVHAESGKPLNLVNAGW
jgi:hypothetical protein